ncbi:MAG: acyl carrier protein [Salinisphaera sp.]|jgi:acyl carrier protein|nr:acyl carrier protein [Salinisphaera sp.]
MSNTQPSKEALCDWLLTCVAAKVKIDRDKIRTDVSMDEYGLDSVSAVSISGELSEMLNRDLPGTLLYEYSTIDELTDHLVRSGAATGQSPASEASA